MTGASTGLESAEATLINPGACASGGVCGDTDDAGEVEAECEASGVSGGEEGYGIAGLGTMGGASFGRETRAVKEGMEALELELTLLLVLGCANGAGAD
jgi:hypothetical protein